MVERMVEMKAHEMDIEPVDKSADESVFWSVYVSAVKMDIEWAVLWAEGLEKMMVVRSV